MNTMAVALGAMTLFGQPAHGGEAQLKNDDFESGDAA